MHSDLHPGNILVSLAPPGGAAGAAALGALRRAAAAVGVDLEKWVGEERLLRPSVVLLDAGMATRLSPTDQRNMVRRGNRVAV